MERHSAFSERLELPYPLVSDADASIAQLYGVARIGGWLPSRRVTFVIDKRGTVRRVIRGELDVGRHVREAIEALRQLDAIPA